MNYEVINKTSGPGRQLRELPEPEIKPFNKEPLELPEGTVFKNCEKHDIFPVLKWWQKVWYFIIKLFKI